MAFRRRSRVSRVASRRFRESECSAPARWPRRNRLRVPSDARRWRNRSRRSGAHKKESGCRRVWVAHGKIVVARKRLSRRFEMPVPSSRTLSSSLKMFLSSPKVFLSSREKSVSPSRMLALCLKRLALSLEMFSSSSRTLVSFYKTSSSALETLFSDLKRLVPVTKTL